MKAVYLLFLLVLINSCSSQKPDNHLSIASPEALYGPLFYDIQNSNITEFHDSKTFCDAVPIFPINMIRDKYHALSNPKDNAAIKRLVHNCFEFSAYSNTFSDKSEIHSHIHKLWDHLTRLPDIRKSGTLIPLPRKYIVPGGRFREIYYWDSYFTMLGLKADKKTTLIRDMIDNFSFLIDTFGFIPNGNRTYYLSRSQPPFFSLMIDLLASIEKTDSIYLSYLKYLRKEYSFWMNGYEKLDAMDRAYRRVVRLDDGSILNRYWDDQDTPRPEAYKEDKRTAHEAFLKLGKKESDTYRNIRAAAESGWDFSSRWLRDTSTLITIHSIDIIPVDLNCLLYNLEMAISKGYRVKGMKDSTAYFADKAIRRKKAINRYCWSIKKEFYMDYDFINKKSTPVFSLAGVFPLYFMIVDNSKSSQVALKIEHLFLKDGGVVTTNIHSGQQWDAPNGWAPMQWITICGLRNYGFQYLAESISSRWTNLNKKIYDQTWKLMEKYNVEDITKLGGGGEYTGQDGFGWTNGVFLQLSQKKDSIH